jgi:two-component system cell cycle sensor histidine kinase/response regulator CckA
MFETQHRCKDGTIKDFECSVAELQLGSKTFGISVERDVTEAKKMQRERESYRASLAQSDRLASMGMLAAGVAHEINNPLSYVLYNLETLNQDAPKLFELVRSCHAELAARIGQDEVARMLGDAQQQLGPAALGEMLDCLREALSGTQRIRTIARSLGTFSRVERVEVGPVEVETCVEHAINMAFNELKYRTRVVKDFSPTPPVLASEGKLAQVFLNLLINAGHAIGEGHVEQNEVRVRTWHEGDSVLVEVSDTGQGIAPEHRARIFEPFFTTKEVGVGSGLGLSICKRIVTELDGDISFTSEVGKGTAFLLRLPQMPSDWHTADKGVVDAALAQPRARGRILVVDDEPGIRATIVRILKRDHDVVTASSGEEALSLLDRDRAFDLIFCDLMMPRMSGMELHTWLAGQDPALAEQIVFITGGAFTPGATEYLGKVGNMRVEKPFDSAAFKKMTHELVLTARSKRA